MLHVMIAAQLMFLVLKKVPDSLYYYFFFFKAPATTEIYTLSLHDALPISHLNGHFNLTTAWTIPLFAIAASEAIRGSTTRWAVLAGLLLGATAYVDYYYVVYQFALALCLVALAAREWSIASRGPSPRSRRLAAAAGALILVDLTVLTAIVVTGGIDARIGPIRIFAHDIFNQLQAFWVLDALSLWLWLRPRVHARRLETWVPRRVARAVLIMTGVFLIAAAPLV